MADRARKSWAVGLICVLFGIASTASAATAEMRTLVVETLIHGEHFGLCMFQLEEQAPGLDCASKWVSASCSGDFNPATLGWRKFEVAQMAQALGKQVGVRVDDARKHNGQCFASRIKLYNTP